MFENRSLTVASYYNCSTTVNYHRKKIIKHDAIDWNCDDEKPAGKNCLKNKTYFKEAEKWFKCIK